MQIERNLPASPTGRCLAGDGRRVTADSWPGNRCPREEGGGGWHKALVEGGSRHIPEVNEYVRKGGGVLEVPRPTGAEHTQDNRTRSLREPSLRSVDCRLVTLTVAFLTPNAPAISVCTTGSFIAAPE